MAETLSAGRIAIEHVLLIAKLAADVQEKAFTHCFDGFYPANNSDRSLVPAGRLQTWIESTMSIEGNGGRDRDRTGDPCLQSRRGKH